MGTGGGSPKLCILQRTSEGVEIAVDIKGIARGVKG